MFSTEVLGTFIRDFLEKYRPFFEKPKRQTSNSYGAAATGDLSQNLRSLRDFHFCKYVLCRYVLEEEFNNPSIHTKTEGISAFITWSGSGHHKGVRSGFR